MRDPAANQREWAAELGALVRDGFLRTVIATSLLTGVFFYGYFFVQVHPAYLPVMMPRTALDLMIPFQPMALVAYISIWVYVGVGPGLQRTVADFSVYGLWLCALCLTGLTIFYFWPTQIPPLLIRSQFPGFVILHRVDEASNACPSMHVAVAIFTAVRVHAVLRSLRVPPWLLLSNAIWFLLIVYSTLAIKQHVVLDVIAGALLGLGFAVMSLRWRPAIDRPAAFTPLTVPPLTAASKLD